MTDRAADGDVDMRLDPDAPLEPEESSRQIAALRTRLGRPGVRVLDLGCGSGRVMVPLLRAGAEVTGVDLDAESLQACRAAAGTDGVRGRWIAGDFTDDALWNEGERALSAAGPFAMVCCLGNTFMLVSDPIEALTLVRRIASLLEPEGVFVLDDFPRALRRELTDGNWQEGISEEGDLQMVWAPGDSVFALRQGGEVRPEDWSIGADERRFRLWDYGALDLLTAHAGLVPLPRSDAQITHLIGWKRVSG